MSNDKKKRRIGARIGGWANRRLGHPTARKASREVVRAGYAEARRTLRPQTMPWSEAMDAWRGRYTDGGYARFAQVFYESGMSIQDLDKRVAQRNMQANVSYAATAVCFGVAIWMTATGGHNGAMTGFALSLGGLFIGFLGLRFGYMAWQMSERRFGGIWDYLKGVKGDIKGRHPS